MSISFDKVPADLFFRNPRPNDPRWGEIARPGTADLPRSGYCLLGYPDDEGVRRNHGRTGAAEAPNRIRAQFYKLAPGLESPPAFHDIGNLPAQGTLEERRERLEEFLTGLYVKGPRVISLGGGHDWALPDAAAFLKAHAKKRCLVVNIDAHLDVRNDSQGVTSGTSFFRLLEDFKNFELVQIGIQPYATSNHHADYVKRKKAKVFYFHEAAGRLAKIFSSLARMRRPLFLSIDIDAFSAAFAPGCSAPAPAGLDASEFVVALAKLLAGGNVRGLGIYEVNPQFDRDEQTSRLAAVIMQNYIMHTEKHAQLRKR